MKTMKEQFKESIRHLYPSAADVEVHQARDVIRVYSMGFADGMMSLSDELQLTGETKERFKQAMLRWVEEAHSLTAENWTPDKSWSW